MQSALKHRVPDTQLVGDVLFGADAIVAEFVRVRLPILRPDFGPFSAIGVVKDGVLLGGLVFHNYVGFNVELSVAFDSAAWCSRRTIRTLAAYPFLQMKVARCTAMTGIKNKKTRKLIEGLGGKLEGVHPKGLDGIQTLVSYGMLKENCRWIKE